MDGLSFNGIPLVGLTAPAVLLLVVVLIVRGALVPRATYDEMRNFLMDDRDQWRDATRISEEARTMQDQQIRELLDQSRATVEILRALQSAASVKGGPP